MRAYVQCVREEYMYVSMYVCIVCMYVCMYVCSVPHVCMYVCMYVLYVCMYIRISAYIYMSIYIRIYLCIYYELLTNGELKYAYALPFLRKAYIGNYSYRPIPELAREIQIV